MKYFLLYTCFFFIKKFIKKIYTQINFKKKKQFFNVNYFFFIIIIIFS